MAAEQWKTIENANAQFTEKRRNGRCPFVARAELMDLVSNSRFSTRTADIDRGGCYIDTLNPLPVGTPVTLQVTKESLSFRADAHVVYTQTAIGMGLAFNAAETEQLRILDRWLSAADAEAGPNRSPSKVSHPLERAPISYVSGRTNAAAQRGEPLMYLILMLVQKNVLSEIEAKALLDKLGA